MTWVVAILVVLVLGGTALVAAGKGTPMLEEYDDRPDALVPADGPLAARDLRRVRFSLTFRGYRMSEVDALLDRLAGQLEERERLAPPATATTGPASPAPVEVEDGGADDDVPPATSAG